MNEWVPSEMKRRTRVVFLNDSSLISGAEKSLALLVKNLPEDQFEKTVICPPGQCAELLKSSGMSQVVTTSLAYLNKSNGVARYLLSTLKLARILRRLRPDLIHCNSYRSAHWGIPLAYLLRVATVCHIRDPKYTRFSTRLMRKAGDRVRFIAVSKDIKERLVRAGVQPDRIAIVYNPPDTEHYHPGLPWSDLVRHHKGVRLGVFGRIEPRKRHIDVIEALPLVAAREKVHLYIVGEAWGQSGIRVEEEVRTRVAELGLDRNVTFAGYRDDVPEIISGCDMVLVPSIDEPFGRVTLEAMLCEKPIIGTWSGATPEIIDDSVSGLLVPPCNPGALAEAVLRLVDDTDFAAQLGKNARERALCLFSLENHLRGVQQVYLELLKKRAVRPGMTAEVTR